MRTHVFHPATTRSLNRAIAQPVAEQIVGDERPIATQVRRQPPPSECSREPRSIQPQTGTCGGTPSKKLARFAMMRWA